MNRNYFSKNIHKNYNCNFMEDITKPAALITGSSSGIGETFARKLSQKGYRLFLVARRKERLEKLAAELGNAEPLVADLTLDADLLAVETRIAAEPKLEFLVNNAGFGVPGMFHETDLEAQHRLHRLHILAIERLTHAALKGMSSAAKDTSSMFPLLPDFLSLRTM